MPKTLIKNLYLAVDQEGISDKTVNEMEAAARAHRTYANLSFKISDINSKRVVIQVIQGRSAQENYFNQKRLREIVHETFSRFFPGRKIDVHATEYKESPVASVNAAWINKMMLETGIKLKTIAEDTGIAATQISRVLGGDELSQPMKAMFWYYFYSKGAVKPDQILPHSGRKIVRRGTS
jgi:hypothetical protein